MPRGIAALIYALGILGLFLLDRGKKSQPSRALWIPVAWLAIGASRSVSGWLGLAPGMWSPDQYLEGNLPDALIFAGLEMAALMVLVARQPRSGAFLRSNGPLLVFFLYCAVSVLWSDYPFVASKRWTKAAGNLIMVLVVLTDPDPVAAVKALLARIGFIVIPLSVLFIKYFPELGRGFDTWTGQAFNTGVTANKNELGSVCLIFGLGALWRFLAAFQSKERPRPAGPLIAHGACLAMVLWLFSMVDSATSLGCFLVGGAALIAFRYRRRLAFGPMAVHILAAGLVAAGLYGLLINTGVGLVQVFGRNETLTTRTELWAELLRMPVNPVFGTGFESFWLGGRAKSLWETHWWHPNQAHNGYLEIYLNLGWLGVAVLGVVIGWGYRNVIGAWQREPELGGLRVAFFLSAVLYNLTEAAFKVIHPVWVIFLLAITVVPPKAHRRWWEREPAQAVASPIDRGQLLP